MDVWRQQSSVMGEKERGREKSEEDNRMVLAGTVCVFDFENECEAFLPNLLLNICCSELLKATVPL